MSANEAGIQPGFAVSSIVHGRGKRAVPARPVVERHEVIIFVETRLRLLPDDVEDLVDSREPWGKEWGQSAFWDPAAGAHSCCS